MGGVANFCERWPYPGNLFGLNLLMTLRKSIKPIPFTLLPRFFLKHIFNNKLTVDYLTKAEFTFESTNSIDREFQLQIDFVDGNDTTQYSVTLLAPQSPNNTDIVTEQVVVFEGNSLQALKSAVKIVFTITLQSGSPINENSIGNIQLKSKGLFYFTINDVM